MDSHDKDAWQTALYILGRRSHSEHELRQKLYQKEHAADDINAAIDRLLTYGYINDNKLATMLFAKYVQVGKYSLRNIICKLKQRGLSDQTIQAAAENYLPEEEWRSALKIVTNRFKSLEDISKEKICRFLGTRGFSTTAINKVLQYVYHTEME